MAAKLSDDEFVARTRANNRRRAERQRQRLTRAGKSVLSVWIPDPVRVALTAKATNDGATIADTAAALLAAALNPATIPHPVNFLPLFAAPAPVEAAPAAPVDRDSRILALKREQPELSHYAIAAQVGCSEPTVRRVLKRLNLEATV